MLQAGGGGQSPASGKVADKDHGGKDERRKEEVFKGLRISTVSKTDMRFRTSRCRVQAWSFWSPGGAEKKSPGLGTNYKTQCIFYL